MRQSPFDIGADSFTATIAVISNMWSRKMMPTNVTSRSPDEPAVDAVSATDPTHLAGVHRSIQPRLPGMEECVRDAVAQPAATPNSRTQFGERHDVESAIQQLKSPIKTLLTKKETANFFSVTERTIDRWLLEGILSASAKIIIGGSVRFRTDVLLECITSSGPTP